MKGSAVHLKRSTQSGASSRPADLALLFELDLPGRAERPELSDECQCWGGPIPRLCDFLRTVAAVWNCSPLPTAQYLRLSFRRSILRYLWLPSRD